MIFAVYFAIGFFCGIAITAPIVMLMCQRPVTIGPFPTNVRGGSKTLPLGPVEVYETPEYLLSETTKGKVP